MPAAPTDAPRGGSESWRRSMGQRPHRRRSPSDLRALLGNAASLTGASFVTLPLGFVFWWLAAHRYPAASVGVASAAVSAMMLLATFSMFGFGTLLIGELARDRNDRPALVATTLVLIGTVGLILGCAFAVAGPYLSAELRPLAADPLTVAVFAAGVALTTAGQVLDAALIGVLRGGLQFWRNAVLGSSKLLVLFALAPLGAWRRGMGIYTTWTIGLFLSLLVVVLVYLHEGLRPRSWRFDWRAVGRLRRSAGWHHALNLSLWGPQWALPVVATSVLSARRGAYFYVAWIIGTIPSMIPGSLATVLYAVSAAEPRILQERIRHTLAYSFAAFAIVGAPIVALAPWLLELFGNAYRSEGAVPLRLIVVAGIPLIVRSHFVAIARSLGRLAPAVALVAVTGLLEVFAAAVGAHAGGLSGLTVGWGIVMCIEASVMAGTVLGRRPLHPRASRDAGGD